MAPEYPAPQNVSFSCLESTLWLLKSNGDSLATVLLGCMTEILFIKTSSLGDVVHQFPAITDAAQANPSGRLSWVVEEAFAPLARLHPGIAEVIPVATRRWRNSLFRAETWREIAAFRRRLRENPFDRVVDTQGLLRSALITLGARGPSHGYDAKSIREPLASSFYASRHSVSRDLHAVTRNRRLTSLALGYALPEGIDYGLTRTAPVQTRSAILLHGTSRASKEWGEEKWIGLGARLYDLGYAITLPSGSERERARSERLAARIPNGRVFDRRALGEVAALIASASLVIGVDTGLLHLASAYQVPLVGIFTGSDPALTGPIGTGQIAVLGAKGVVPPLADVMSAVERVAI